MWDLLRWALFDPDAVFADGPPAPRRTAAVLGATSAGCLATVPVVVSLLQSDEVPESVVESLPAFVYAAGEADVAVPGLYALLVGVAAAMPAIAVAIYVALFHGLSWPVAGSGTLRETLAVTVWGLVPQTLFCLPMLAVLYASFLGGLWPLNVQITLPARVIASRPAPSVPWLLLETVGALSVLWTGWIWSRGLAVVRGTSRRRAAAVVAIPLLLTLVLTPPGTRLVNWLAVSLVGGGSSCPC